MDVIKSRSVEIALRTLRDGERRRVLSLIDHLKNWDNDPHMRKMSQKLAGGDIYVLNGSDDIRIFFEKEGDQITVVDIAKKATIDQFADAE